MAKYRGCMVEEEEAAAHFPTDSKVGRYATFHSYRNYPLMKKNRTSETVASLKNIRGSRFLLESVCVCNFQDVAYARSRADFRAGEIVPQSAAAVLHARRRYSLLRRLRHS